MKTIKKTKTKTTVTVYFCSRCGIRIEGRLRKDELKKKKCKCSNCIERSLYKPSTKNIIMFRGKRDRHIIES